MTAASEEAKPYPLPYFELLSAARTPLVDFVNSLLVEKREALGVGASTGKGLSNRGEEFEIF
jgi:hypothetical protein